jgi:hypothetical protein
MPMFGRNRQSAGNAWSLSATVEEGEDGWRVTWFGGRAAHRFSGDTKATRFPPGHRACRAHPLKTRTTRRPKTTTASTQPITTTAALLVSILTASTAPFFGSGGGGGSP